MKIRFLFIVVLCIHIATAQNDSFAENLQDSLKYIPKEEQLQRILKIPHDKLIGNIAISEKLAQKAVDIATALHDNSSLAQAYLQLAQVYSYQDKREKQIIFRLKAINIFEEMGEIERAGYSYGELGFSIKRENMTDGLYYMRKGLGLLKLTNKIYKADATYDNYGILQGMLKIYDSAIFYHNKSLHIKKLNNDSIGIPYGYVHLANVHINLKNFSVAKKYIDSAHIIRQKRNDLYGITDDYVYYGDLFFAEKKYQKAIENFKKGYELSLKNNFHSLRKYCADFLTRSYDSINDFEKAYAYSKIYQILKDSTINAQTNSKVERLKIEFETTRKEKKILEQKEQLFQNELLLKNKNLVTYILILGVLILVIISFGLLKWQQHKHRELRNELELKEAQTYSKLQDQRLRISRDLHDNIGSQLTLIISSIDNLKFLTKKSNENLRNKLTEINKFAGITISQLRDTIWAMNKTEISLEDFQERILSLIEKVKTVATNTLFSFNSAIKSDIVFSSIKGINVFRVVQEAINNSLKYANPSLVSVNLTETSDELIIEVADNGKGFDITTVELGNGLENMQNRMEEIGSKISIQSEINKGTTITISCKKNRTNAV